MPSFTLHSFLQRAVAKDLEGSQSSQTRQLCTAGAHSITQSCGVVTSQQGTALLADTCKAGEITLTEMCF